MKKRTGTLTEIIEGEQDKALNALNKYGENFAHNLRVSQFLENFLADLKTPQDIFLRFYFSMRNFYLLTLFSIIRLHKVQASLNLRQLIEYGTDAAYSIAFPDMKGFAETDKYGIMDSTQDLKNKRYKWLNKNYKATSEAILRIKEPIQVSSHSNIVDTNRGFKCLLAENHTQIETSYFDFDDDYMEKASLWQLANTALAIVGLCYEINLNYNKIEILSNFAEEHAVLMQENQEIKDKFTQTERFKDADALALTREKDKKTDEAQL